MVLHILDDNVTIITRSQREEAARKVLTQKVTYFQHIVAAAHCSWREKQDQELTPK